MLPDTYGTTQFLADAPDWTADWTGQRIDSKDPYVAGDEYIAWLKSGAETPSNRSSPPTPWMWKTSWVCTPISWKHGAGSYPQDFRSAADLDDPAKWTPGPRIRFSAGWGTLLTNDFRGCHPSGRNGFHPASLICKMTEADGRPAVRLSDNYARRPDGKQK